MPRWSRRSSARSAHRSRPCRRHERRAARVRREGERQCRRAALAAIDLGGAMNDKLLSRRDLDFMLYEWLDVGALVARPRHAEHSRETMGAALDAFAKVAVECFQPHNRSSDLN